MKLSLISVRQLVYVKLCVAILLFSALIPATASTKDFENSTHVEYPAWFVDNPFFDLAEINEDVKESGKKGTMVLFTTKGCSYCEQFIRRSLGNPEIAKSVQEKFESIGMEIFDDAEMVTPQGESIAIKHFAKNEGVSFAPTLLFYDKDGKRVLRQVGYQAPERFVKLMDYVSAGEYQKTSLRDYLAQSQDISTEQVYPKLKQDKLFDTPPYALDRSRIAANEPLMVLFEKPGCVECESFHNDVLTIDEVRDTLEKFQVVRLDAGDHNTPVLLPDGKKMTPAKWFAKTDFTRLPALVFFEEGGKQVLQTDALVLRSRMMNSLNYMLEKAHQKNWTYQQFARAKGIEKNLKTQSDQK